MSCDVCGRRAPTKYVEFYQNIGMLIMRTSKSVKGELCKECINKHFWEFTLITAVAGWWGLISFFLTPIFLANNVFRFCTTLGMTRDGGSLPARASPSEHPTLSLTSEARARLDPFAGEVRQRLGAGEELDDVAGAVARKAGVSAVQAELFAKELG
jgi:hypothetical protein